MPQVPNKRLFKIKKRGTLTIFAFRGLRLPVQQISKPTPFYGREHRQLTLVVLLKLSKFLKARIKANAFSNMLNQKIVSVSYLILIEI